MSLAGARPAENPFAAHRIDRLPYIARGTSRAGLLVRLEKLRFRAAIVGPHGSGKTTLLEELGRRLSAVGPVRLHRGADLRVALRDLRRHVDPHAVLLVDAGERIGPVTWLRLRASLPRRAGLVITSLRPGRLPTLFETRTDPELLGKLVARLAPEEAPGLSPILDDLFVRHGGDLRECFRELYDLHAGRTPRDLG